jgi:hypothetical protein
MKTFDERAGGEVGVRHDRTINSPLVYELPVDGVGFVPYKADKHFRQVRATTLTFSSTCPVSIGHAVVEPEDDLRLSLVRLGCHDKVDPTQPCGLPVIVRVGYVFLGVHDYVKDKSPLKDRKVGVLYHIGEFAVVGGKYLDNALSQISGLSLDRHLRGKVYLIITFSILPSQDCGGSHTIRSIIERRVYNM